MFRGSFSIKFAALERILIHSHLGLKMSLAEIRIKFIILLIFLITSVAISQNKNSFFLSTGIGDFHPFVVNTSFEEYDYRDNLAFGCELGHQWKNGFRTLLRVHYFSRKGYPLTFTNAYGDWQYVRDGTAFFQQWIYYLNFGAVFWENKNFRLSLLYGTCFTVVKRKHKRTENFHFQSYYDATGTTKELGVSGSFSIEVKLKTKKVIPFIEITGFANKFLPTLFFFEEFGGIAVLGGVRYFFRAQERKKSFEEIPSSLKNTVE